MTPTQTAIRDRIVQAIDTICVFTPAEDQRLTEITKHFTRYGSVTSEQWAFVDRLIREKGSQ